MTSPASPPFATWLRTHAARLASLPSDTVADEAGAALAASDPRLGVEVADGAPGTRRALIVTAHGDPTLHDAARALVAALGEHPAWHYVALRPPRGFDFTLALGDHELHAGDLAFVLTPAPPRLRLVLPTDLDLPLPTGPARAALARLIVETGVGEALAATLETIELVVDDDPLATPVRALMLALRAAI